LTIKQLRILPPFAIGRLGSADEPMDNYTIDLDMDPGIENPLGYRQIKPQETLVVGQSTGEIESVRTPTVLEFKHDGKIRPVAPFLEVFVDTGAAALEPLTLKLLAANGLTIKDVSWRVTVSNRKVSRRTGDDDDIVLAHTDWFSNHGVHVLEGKCNNFISADAFVDFGRVRFIRPNNHFPEIRLRFTPAAGLIYGADESPEAAAAQPVAADAPVLYQIPEDRAVYDHEKSWYHFDPNKDPEAPLFRNDTLPPALFAIEPPAPSWLYDNQAISRGYLDDACDGFVEVRLKLHDGSTIEAKARICAAPPAMAPDSLFVRSLADDLEQIIDGPDVAEDEASEVTRARAQDVVRRAYETVRFMNVAVMNGNDFKGRPALSLDSMPEEEAADTERAIRPIMAPGTVDTLAIMTLHQQAFAALRGGAAPWFLRLLRRPDEAADFTDRGRRKMPALMCGADNNYLALTWRQIDTIRKAALGPIKKAAPDPSVSGPAAVPAAKAGLTPKNLSAQISHVARGNPISSRPVTSVANCCPGLEVDFRAVWRRLFKGVELREYDNLVITVDPDCNDVVSLDIDGHQFVGQEKNGKAKPGDLTGHRLLRVVLTQADADDINLPMMTPILGPASSDPEGQINLTTESNPSGLAPLEWSNALARVLQHAKGKTGVRVRCDFSAERSPEQQLPLIEDPKNYVSFYCEVRPFFQDDTAVISDALAKAGELTQGLCSPWQNDYRECSCYYWASARPDYVNVEPTTTGLSTGDNWMQNERSGSYVADDYADTRLIMYDELFRGWETLLKFQVGGRDLPDPPLIDETGKKT